MPTPLNALDESPADVREQALQPLTPLSLSPALTLGADVPGAAGPSPVALYLARLTTPASRRSMRAALETVAAELGVRSPASVPWALIRYAHVMTLRARLAERLAPATVNRILCAVRGVCQEAMRLDLLPAEDYTRIADVGGIRASRLPKGRHVEGPELVRLFGGCDGSTAAGVRDLALLAVLRVAGLRRAEIAALDLGHLERPAWSFRVQGKGNKERRAYVLQAEPEIAAWLAVRGEAEGPLFCAVNKADRPTFGRLGGSGIAYILERAAERAGVAAMSPHDLRRTMVGDLLDLGADLATVQKLAGHAQVTTTQRYDRRGDRAAARAAALLSVPRIGRETTER